MNGGALAKYDTLYSPTWNRRNMWQAVYYMALRSTPLRTSSRCISFMTSSADNDEAVRVEVGALPQIFHSGAFNVAGDDRLACIEVPGYISRT